MNNTVSAWMHSRKGRLVGTIIWQDDTWSDIELFEVAWRDARHRHRVYPGDIIRCRTEFLTEVPL